MARQPRVPPTSAPPKPKPTAPTPSLRVSQIGVTVVLLNEHDAPVPGGEPIVFVGDEKGTAAENAAAWLATTLPVELEFASAQLVTAAAVDTPTES